MFFDFAVLLLFPFFLFSQTQIDTIYSTPTLDGTILLHDISKIKYIDTNDHYIGAGDHGDMLYGGMDLMRGYLTFDLLDLPKNINILEATLSVYQFRIAGNSQLGIYPVWDIPGGDTLFCMVDYITYGDTLDTLDWSAGDPGDYQTLQPKIGIISQDTTIGYKIIDVTRYLRYDMESGREKTQFRIAFDIQESDDKASDQIIYGAGELYPEEGVPYLIVKYSINSAVEVNRSFTPSNFRLYQNYPNPFNLEAVFCYELPFNGSVKLHLFNTMGIEVKRLVNEVQSAGFYRLIFSAKDLPSGIYFYRLTLIKQNVTVFTDRNKMLIIK